MSKLCWPPAPRYPVLEPWTELKDGSDLSYNDIVSQFLPQLLIASASYTTSEHWALMDPDGPQVPRDTRKGLVAVATENGLFLFLQFLRRQDSAVASSLYAARYPLLAYAVPTCFGESKEKGATHATADTVRQLLGLGQNPNQKYAGPSGWSECTVWEAFLVYGGDCLKPLNPNSKFHHERHAWVHWLDFVTPLVEYGADLQVRCRLRCVVDGNNSALFIVALVIWRFKTTQSKHVELLRAMIEKGATLSAGELHTFQTLINPTPATEPLARDIVEALSAADSLEEVAVAEEAFTSTPPFEASSRTTSSSLRPLVVSEHDEARPVAEGSNLEANNMVFYVRDVPSLRGSNPISPTVPECNDREVGSRNAFQRALARLSIKRRRQ
ncbi:hypothetical protein PG996_015523 [Apiospora saccharicola]|uniref:Uncharacterized protein n=1 Tax=Apiospora saccharicola TaxID=335842 RepID=A0ABR1TLF0_9PEZI